MTVYSFVVILIDFNFKNQLIPGLFTTVHHTSCSICLIRDHPDLKMFNGLYIKLLNFVKEFHYSAEILQSTFI